MERTNTLSSSGSNDSSASLRGRAVAVKTDLAKASAALALKRRHVVHSSTKKARTKAVVARAQAVQADAQARMAALAARQAQWKQRLRQLSDPDSCEPASTSAKQRSVTNLTSLWEAKAAAASPEPPTPPPVYDSSKKVFFPSNSEAHGDEQELALDLHSLSNDTLSSNNTTENGTLQDDEVVDDDDDVPRPTTPFIPASESGRLIRIPSATSDPQTDLGFPTEQAHQLPLSPPSLPSSPSAAGGRSTPSLGSVIGFAEDFSVIGLPRRASTAAVSGMDFSIPSTVPQNDEQAALARMSSAATFVTPKHRMSASSSASSFASESGQLAHISSAATFVPLGANIANNADLPVLSSSSSESSVGGASLGSISIGAGASGRAAATSASPTPTEGSSYSDTPIGELPSKLSRLSMASMSRIGSESSTPRLTRRDSSYSMVANGKAGPRSRPSSAAFPPVDPTAAALSLHERLAALSTTGGAGPVITPRSNDLSPALVHATMANALAAATQAGSSHKGEFPVRPASRMSERPVTSSGTLKSMVSFLSIAANSFVAHDLTPRSTVFADDDDGASSGSCIRPVEEEEDSRPLFLRHMDEQLAKAAEEEAESHVPELSDSGSSSSEASSEEEEEGYSVNPRPGKDTKKRNRLWRKQQAAAAEEAAAKKRSFEVFSDPELRTFLAVLDYQEAEEMTLVWNDYGDGINAIKAELNSRLEQRREIAKEILASEESYVDSLKKVIAEFHTPLIQSTATRKPLLPAAEIAVLFSNLESLLAFNNGLLTQLKSRIGDGSQWEAQGGRLGDIFAAAAPYLPLYSQYINGYDAALTTLDTALHRTPRLASWLQSQEEAIGISLDSLLIQPVQRIPRYVLLLRELVRATPKDHSDSEDLAAALVGVEAAASAVNAAKEAAFNLQRLMHIQHSLDGGAPNLVHRSRQVLGEGRAYVSVMASQSAPATGGKVRHLFLVTDAVVMTVPRTGRLFKKSRRTQEDRFMFKELIPLSSSVQLTRDMDGTRTGRAHGLILHVPVLDGPVKDSETGSQWSSLGSSRPSLGGTSSFSQLSEAIKAHANQAGLGVWLSLTFDSADDADSWHQALSTALNGFEK